MRPPAQYLLLVHNPRTPAFVWKRTRVVMTGLSIGQFAAVSTTNDQYLFDEMGVPQVILRSHLRLGEVSGRFMLFRG
jgi:hypothetical protein